MIGKTFTTFVYASKRVGTKVIDCDFERQTLDDDVRIVSIKSLCSRFPLVLFVVMTVDIKHFVDGGCRRFLFNEFHDQRRKLAVDDVVRCSSMMRMLIE